MATTDGEITGVAEEEPDLSDLAMVVMNVETRDGRQLSIALGIEDARHRISMSVVDDRDSVEIRGDEGVVRRLTTEEWIFTVTRTTS